MTEKEQIVALEEDLDRLIKRYMEEFDLTVASAVGVLQVEVWRLIHAVTETD